MMMAIRSGISMVRVAIIVQKQPAPAQVVPDIVIMRSSRVNPREFLSRVENAVCGIFNVSCFMSLSYLRILPWLSELPQ